MTSKTKLMLHHQHLWCLLHLEWRHSKWLCSWSTLWNLKTEKAWSFFPFHSAQFSRVVLIYSLNLLSNLAKYNYHSYHKSSIPAITFLSVYVLCLVCVVLVLWLTIVGACVLFWKACDDAPLWPDLRTAGSYIILCIAIFLTRDSDEKFYVLAIRLMCFW